MSDTHNQDFKTLQLLCHAEMLYRGGEAITSPEGKVGEYIGSGDGTVKGKIQGKIRWDLYEDIDDDVCLTNFAGEIETDDGAVTRYDARGHGKVPNLEKPNEWVMGYGVKFDTDSQGYVWLNATLGVWEGEFNMETYRHHYCVYAHISGHNLED